VQCASYRIVCKDARDYQPAQALGAGCSRVTNLDTLPSAGSGRSSGNAVLTVRLLPQRPELFSVPPEGAEWSSPGITSVMQDLCPLCS
jgi:hypothetical protein